MLGERIAFDNPEALTLLGALAAWTDRVRLVTTVVVPQLHDPVMLAKALATGDMLSGGRLTVGLGVGGRHEDYHAVGADPATQTMRGMADRVAVMKRIWSGDKVTESVVPVGPPPAQAGGPKLLVGTMGPKTVRSAAVWADGLAGTTLDLDLDKQNELFEVARAAWAEAGKRKPHLATSFWFAIGDGDDARAQMHRHLRRYMNWIPSESSMPWRRRQAGRVPTTNCPTCYTIRRHWHRRDPSDPDELKHRPGAAGRRCRGRLHLATVSLPDAGVELTRMNFGVQRSCAGCPWRLLQSESSG